MPPLEGALPDGFEVVDALPRTPTGKLLKYALREKYKGYKLTQASAWTIERFSPG